ncbi:EamA-like transporter family protein [Paenibacillus algorifonticola]|uniref:EamA-like transporter family protein n=1 Tax=Paenibacillus algorifonticola TaxID=684063 RepID=A0A1I2BBS8_9BACL|nr:EamA family transporter [Paenibacillus algorifonticola]SFE53672.1 EamA-like transporter family protein [Paenibacillus algorifonticola]
MWLTVAISSAILFGLAGWWMKRSQMSGGTTSALLLGLYASGTFGFGVHAAFEGSLASLADYRIWVAGAIIGAGSAIGNAVFMKALDYGPASLTSPLTNMNIMLVVALGTLVYKEPLHLTQACGILLLLLSVVLISYKKQIQAVPAQRQWFLYVGAAVIFFTFRNGGLKVTEGWGFASAPILFVGYLLSFLWFALQSKEKNGSTRKSAYRTGLLYGLLAGLFSYAGLQLYATALATGPANLAAPIFATNSLVVAAGAILIYKEKLNAAQWAAFACMMIGLVVIRL